MSAVVGIDLGKRKIDLSLFLGGKLVDVWSLTTKKKERQFELHEIGRFAEVNSRFAHHIFIEEPMIGRGIRASMSLAETAGAVMAALGRHPGYGKVYLVPVATWKKDVIGRGNAKKEDVADWLKSSHPAYATVCGDSQDRIDAACIGIYGVQAVERAGQLGQL